MFSDYALASFKKYMETTPPRLIGLVPPRNPAGAYDSKFGARDHGFGVRRRLTQRDFEKGGVFAFDASEPDDEGAASSGKALALLKHLASKLSAEDWAELQEHLCGEMTEDDPPEFGSGQPKVGGGKVGAMDAAARASFAESFPNAARTRSDAVSYTPAPSRSKPATSAAAQAFAEMFPDANRVRSL